MPPEAVAEVLPPREARVGLLARERVTLLLKPVARLPNESNASTSMSKGKLARFAKGGGLIVSLLAGPACTVKLSVNPSCSRLPLSCREVLSAVVRTRVGKWRPPALIRADTE